MFVEQGFSTEGQAQRRRWIKSFRAKFILVVGAAVVFDLLLSGTVALWNVGRLGNDASSEIQHGLERATNEYLENYLETTALRANLLFAQVNAEVTALAGSMQTLIDRPDAQARIGNAVSGVPYFSGTLRYDAPGGWVQNTPGDPSVISIWGYLLGPDKQPLPEVLRDVQDTAIFDLASTSLMSAGAQKLQMYYVGPKARPIMRTTPYSEQAQTFDRLYPGHNTKNFWDFFFPGIYESWQGWAKAGQKPANGSFVTSTAPYIDAITGNLIVTFFHPLWNAARNDCAGAVAVDITLEQLSRLIMDVKVAQTGFAFLAMSDGNVLAVTPAGEKTLGLAIKNESGGEGVTGLDRNLARSIHPQIAALRLPTSSALAMHHIQRKDESHFVVLRRLDGMNLWSNGGVAPDHATLGFVVPEREVYAALDAAQTKISQATSRIRNWQLGILFLSLAIVLGAVFSISRRITAGIIDLGAAAKRIEGKDYSVRVEIPTNDEVGELGRAFNKMTAEIESHTSQLEGRVEERTQKLAAANAEIQALNEKLAGENSRMGAELEVARRMQMMVLPRPEELQAVPGLDIAGHMEPACEVGGDYYDVLKVGSRVKIGIGDVTGHGLESGVLMLMVQSAARTLLESGETDPRRFLCVLNAVICKNMARSESGNTLTLSFLDFADGVVTLSGQHEEVVIIRASGTVERIDTIDLGFPIGLADDIAPFVQVQELRFAAGDLMILFTDGITEAESPAGTLFGLERLCASARALRAGSAAEIKEGIVREVMAHIDTQKVHDDITLVVLKHR